MEYDTNFISCQYEDMSYHLPIQIEQDNYCLNEIQNYESLPQFQQFSKFIQLENYQQHQPTFQDNDNEFGVPIHNYEQKASCSNTLAINKDKLNEIQDSLQSHRSAINNSNPQDGNYHLNEQFLVEKVLDKKTTALGQILYKVKWQNYAMSKCTWEPLENLQNALSLVKEFDQQGGSITPQKKRGRPTKINQQLTNSKVQEEENCTSSTKSTSINYRTQKQQSIEQRRESKPTEKYRIFKDSYDKIRIINLAKNKQIYNDLYKNTSSPSNIDDPDQQPSKIILKKAISNEGQLQILVQNSQKNFNLQQQNEVQNNIDKSQLEQNQPLKQIMRNRLIAKNCQPVNYTKLTKIDSDMSLTNNKQNNQIKKKIIKKIIQQENSQQDQAIIRQGRIKRRGRKKFIPNRVELSPVELKLKSKPMGKSDVLDYDSILRRKIVYF